MVVSQKNKTILFFLGVRGDGPGVSEWMGRKNRRESDDTMKWYGMLWNDTLRTGSFVQCNNPWRNQPAGSMEGFSNERKNLALTRSPIGSSRSSRYGTGLCQNMNGRRGDRNGYTARQTDMLGMTRLSFGFTIGSQTYPHTLLPGRYYTTKQARIF